MIDGSSAQRDGGQCLTNADAVEQRTARGICIRQSGMWMLDDLNGDCNKENIQKKERHSRVQDAKCTFTEQSIMVVAQRRRFFL